MAPSPYEFVLLALAAFRLFRFLSYDDFPPVERIRARLLGEHADPGEDGAVEYRYDRPLAAHFVACGFCLGFWVSAAIYAAWLLAPRGTLYAAVPLALSATVGLTVKRLDP